MLSWRTSYKAGNFIIIIIITIIITVVLLRHHEAEDAGITILRNVGKHLTLDGALTCQKTCIFNTRLFIFFK